MHVWHKLGRLGEITELVLGGGVDFSCPVDFDELLTLLPTGGQALVDLKELFLWDCVEVDDCFLRRLVSVGCGQNLTGLTLSCECSCFGCVSSKCSRMWSWSVVRTKSVMGTSIGSIGSFHF